MLKQMAAPAATSWCFVFMRINLFVVKLNDLLIYIARLISCLLNKINRFKLYLARFANLFRLIDFLVLLWYWNQLK